MIDGVILRSITCGALLGLLLHGVESSDPTKEDNRSMRRPGQLDTLDRHRRRQSSSRSLSKNDESYLPYWFCPDVTCMEVPSTCSNVEYIVYEPEYLIQGRRVKVRCESCPYCLDMPAHFNQQLSILRRRRSVKLLDMIQQVAATNECETMTCPPVSGDCQDIRLTNVKSNQGEGRSCGMCPGCYDNTIHSASVLLS